MYFCYISFYSIPSDSPIPVSIDHPTNSLWDTALIPAFLEGTGVYYQKLLGPITAYRSFPLQQIVEDIAAGSLLVCSDGSFGGTTGTGTFGWVLATTGRCVRFRNAGPVDCHPDMKSSYRVELSGLLAVSYLLTRICTPHRLLTGSITLYCDHKGAIRNVFHKEKLGITPFTASDYDIIHLAKQILKSLPVKITAQWVKGHSTAKKKSVQEELNIIANELAGDYALAPHPKHCPSCLPLFVCCMIDLLLPPVYTALSQLVFTGDLLPTISSRKLAGHNTCLIW
jgi:ribonuclease HI